MRLTANMDMNGHERASIESGKFHPAHGMCGRIDMCKLQNAKSWSSLLLIFIIIYISYYGFCSIGNVLLYQVDILHMETPLTYLSHSDPDSSMLYYYFFFLSLNGQLSLWYREMGNFIPREGFYSNSFFLSW